MVGGGGVPVGEEGVAVAVGATFEAVVERTFGAARGPAELLDREGLRATGPEELEAELEPVGLSARGDDWPAVDRAWGEVWRPGGSTVGRFAPRAGRGSG